MIDAAQNIDKVIAEIDAIRPASRQQALHNGDTFGVLLGPTEQTNFFCGLGRHLVQAPDPRSPAKNLLLEPRYLTAQNGSATRPSCTTY